MIHLHVRSWFSFLAGASAPQRLVEAAVAAGQTTLALTDLHSLSGGVQFTQACRKGGIKPILGAEVVVSGFPLVLLCLDREGYANLCDLLTLAHRNESPETNRLPAPATPRHRATHGYPSANRRQPAVTLALLESHAAGLICLTGDRWGALATFVRQGQHNLAREELWLLKSIFPDRLFVEVTHHQRQGDAALVTALSTIAAQHQLPLVATNAVRHATSAEYALYDALTCAPGAYGRGHPSAASGQ